MRNRRVLARVALYVVLGAVILVRLAGYRGALRPFGVHRPANSITVIAPYRYAGTWVFDDAALGLHREAFVSGIPEMIDAMVKDIPDAEKGFRLTFSAQSFPGHEYKLAWLRGDKTGNWYRCEELKMEGWLCPAMFKYFADAPKEIYVKVERK